MMHIILHKVRGEPAFDIAIQMKIGDEEGWIIPTSGHRAYPYSKWPLGNFLAIAQDDLVPIIPPEWPDHYQVTREPKQSVDIGQLLQGLMPTTGKFPRRA